MTAPTPALSAPDSVPVVRQVRRARAVVVTRTCAYLFVVAMLGFGILPLTGAATGGRPLWTVLAGAVTFAAVAWAFMRVVSVAMRHPWQNRPARATLTVAGLVLVLPLLYSDWHLIAFLAVAAVAVALRPRYGLPVAAAILVVITTQRMLLGVAGVAYLALQDLLTSVALAGIVLLVAFVDELFAARADLARLAVDAERSRFARDMHDTLGHNLSAVALKSDLAARLISVDPARSRAELAGIQALAQDSLRDVRAVVKGYRRACLARELDGVGSVLESAGIRFRVDRSGDTLPEAIEEALAWAVREAATNLLRHSTASRCDISLRQDADGVRLTVANDGVSGIVPDSGGGSGLVGLTERLAPIGGRLSAGVRPDGDFALKVFIPIN